MKKILSFLLVLLPLLSNAEVVPENRARAVAEAFMQQQTVTKAAEIQLELVRLPLTKTLEAPALYLYDNKAGRGFVLIAGDDLAAPVLGCSMTGNVGSGQLSPDFLWWMDFYSREISWAREHQLQATDAVRRQWESLADSREISFEDGVQPVGNVVRRYETAAWDQDEPYWDDCPLYKHDHTYTGCLITATCIVMRYHRWPDCGVGSSSNYTTDKNGIFVPSRRFDRNYDWDSMPLAYKKGKYTDYQAQQVARLMADVGAILKADYGSRSDGGTGAYMEDVPAALSKYMKYDKRIRVSKRDFYKADTWLKLVKEQLDQRPIIYGGLTQKRDAGHAFVFDGYTDKDYFHVNWGWGGVSDGWFLMSALDPDQQGAGGADSGFSTGQDAVFNMFKEAGGLPEDQVGMVGQTVQTSHGERRYQGIWSSQTDIRPHQDFMLGAGVFYNNGNRDFVGDIALAVVDRADQVKQILCAETFTAEEPMENAYVYWINDQTVRIDVDLQPGDRIVAVFKGAAADTWKPVLYSHDQRGFTGEILLVEDLFQKDGLENNLNLSFDKKSGELSLLVPETVSVKLETAEGEDKTLLCVRNGAVMTIDSRAMGKGAFVLTFSRGEEVKVLRMKF